MSTLDVKRRPDDPRARAALERMLAANSDPDRPVAPAGAGLDLRGADPSWLFLADALLQDARLDGVALAGADLRRAMLHGASLEGADLAGARGSVWGPVDAGAPGAPEPLDGEAMLAWLRELGAGEVSEAQPLSGPPDEL